MSTDPSLDYDREIKIPLYARANIQEAWLINLQENCIEIYSSPSASGYEIRRIARNSNVISLKSLPDVSLTVNQIL